MALLTSNPIALAARTPSPLLKGQSLQLTNPHDINLALPFIYFIRVVDDRGAEYRYVGRARAASQLNEYVRDIDKISRGIPRGRIQRYRAVHFALAQAGELGWQYEILPIENVADKNELGVRRQHHMSERHCNLNGARTWSIDCYRDLTLWELLR